MGWGRAAEALTPPCADTPLPRSTAGGAGMGRRRWALGRLMIGEVGHKIFFKGLKK
jgi:hypothetical protein